MNNETPFITTKQRSCASFRLKNNVEDAQSMRSKLLTPSSNSNPQNRHGDTRKRSLSGSNANDFDTPKDNKKAKVMLSPHSDRKEYVRGKSLGSFPLLSLNTPSPPSSLTANFAVLAVIIFYSAFEYLDQWPAILVEV